jgi:hypothetical protein
MGDEALKERAFFKSYVRLVTDEEPQRLALFWNPHITKEGLFTYLSSRPQSVAEEKPLSAWGHMSRCKYDFRKEAERAASKYGYSGKLIQFGDWHAVDELADTQNTGDDQFAFLAFFETEKPLSNEEAEQVLEKYKLAHPNTPQGPNVPSPVLRTQAEIAESEDVYHRIVKDARDGILFRKR